MKIPAVVLLLVWVTAPALSAAGAVLPVRPKVPEVEGFLSQSLVAPDGAVFVAGSFTSVDGIARPGLAKLTPRGRLDRRFRPEIVAGPLRPGDAIPIAYVGNYTQPMFLTRDGTLLYPSFGRLLACRSDGAIDRRFNRLHQSGTYLAPVAEQDGLLYLARIEGAAQRLEAYHASTLEPAPLPGQETWPGPFLTGAPAGEGKLWIVGGTIDYIGSGSSVLRFFRVLQDGALDPTFTPFELPTGYSAAITPLADGGFRLVLRNYSRWRYSPSPSYESYHVKWYSRSGEERRLESFTFSAGTPFLGVDEPDGSFVHNIGPNRNASQPTDGRGFSEVPALLRLRPDGTRDPAFYVPLEELSLQRMADGRLQHSHLHRVHPDGAPDASWRVPDVSNDPSIRIVGQLPDGRTLIVRYRYSLLFGAILPSISADAFLLLDHRLRRDRRFRPSADLPPMSAIKIAFDGSIVLSLNDDVTMPDGSLTRLVRLRPDGSVDPSSPRYRPPPSGYSIGPDGEIIPGSPTGVFVAHPLPDGKFLIERYNFASEVPGGSVVRIHPDGSRDLDYIGPTRLNYGRNVLILADGAIVGSEVYYPADGSDSQVITSPNFYSGRPLAELPSGAILFAQQKDIYTSELIKWHPESGIDPSFNSALLDGTSISSAEPVADGRIVVAGYRLVTASGESKMVRLNRDGSLDPTFRAPEPNRVVPSTRGLRFIARGGDLLPATWTNRADPASFESLLYDSRRERLLVAGEFTHLDRIPRPGIAALGMARPRCFRDWARSFRARRLEDPEADADHDGVANLHEYAVGSNPLVADNPPALRVMRSDPPSFRLELDPAAVGVEPILELSSNLRDWQPVDQTQATLERGDHQVTWSLRAPSPHTYARVRFVEVP